MKKLLISLLTLVSLSLSAQDIKIIKGDCMPTAEELSTESVEGGSAAVVKVPKRLPPINSEWDSTRIYHQLVVLIEFDGDSTYFHMENPRAAFDRMFNEKGYNQRKGPGCVADYFRTQSGGLFNLQFDVYGPYRLSLKSQPYDNPDDNTRNYGREAMIAATKMLVNDTVITDYAPYDWNGNGNVNQVVFIFAGYTGNVSSNMAYGHVWPNTSTFTPIKTPDGKTITDYSCSGELWPSTSANPQYCGLGTMCHEYTHSLGLPDIYPTTASAGYSMLDEWDLMDGGNFTDQGWCPCNYTPIEKDLLGWGEIVELTEPTSVRDLKPSEEGGTIYGIRHATNEWLLLENRQQRGWDKGVPGKGLVIYHLLYNKSRWSANTVNNKRTERGFDLVHADNMDYDASLNWAMSIGKQYQNAGKMNSYVLSRSPYPYITDSICNDSLTDLSVPASIMIKANDAGSNYLSKAITNIKMSEDGLVSFDFMGGSVSAIREVNLEEETIPAAYDLNGRYVGATADKSGRHGLYLIRRADGTVRKVIR